MFRRIVSIVVAMVGLWAGKGIAADWAPTRSQRAQLQLDKIVFTDTECRQIYAPYLEPDMPVFITSDSILNAYHVLLEESVLRLEAANSERLPAILEDMWRGLQTADPAIQGRPELVAAARRRAQIVLGTAIRLLGGVTIEPEAEVAQQIDEEVVRVQAAKGPYKPAWLGPPDDPQLLAIDYSRYRPRGFYAQVDSLARYFQAVAWLQSIPFRVDRDEELLAVLMLAGGVAGREDNTTFFECFRELIGDRDDWDLTVAAAELPDGRKLDLAAGDLEAIRSSLQAEAKQTGHRPQINDQLVAGPEALEKMPLSLRILSAYRLPDAILFSRTTRIHGVLPSGLEVCTALGSPYAAERLNRIEGQQVVDAVEQSKDLFTGSSLYCDYLDCMATLLSEPPAGAPSLMSSEIWQAKSCQTTLAGWAQLRHTWALQAKQTVMVLSDEDRKRHAGFVEPNPEFFKRLEALATKTATLLDRVPTQVQTRFAAIAQLSNLLRTLENKGVSGEKWDSYNIITLGMVTGEWLSEDDLEKMDEKQLQKLLARSIASVRDVLDKVQKKEIPAEKIAWGGSESAHEPSQKLWRDLAALSARLRSLAEKQLAMTPFTEEDKDFIWGYGKKLAPLLFHIGHTSETPRDDVPRIIDVVSNPKEGEYLEVGIGRPRIIYVLYPAPDGGNVVCRGAVLPYYEFRSAKRLDDLEWKAMLDSKNAPDQPAWLQPAGLGSRITSDGMWLAGVLVIILAVWMRRRRNRRNAGVPPLAA